MSPVIVRGVPMRAAVLLIGVLVTLNTACTATPPANDDSRPNVSVRVDAPVGTLAPGATVQVTATTIPSDSEDFVVGPTVEIRTSDGSQPLGPVTVRFPAPQTGTDALIAYRDEASGWWLPVATSVDPATGELTAKVDHFSVWSTIRDSIIEVTSQAPGSVQTGASWLEYWGGRLLGNRGAPPTCSGAMPSWVAAPLVVNEDPNAELMACGDADGDQLELRLVNNRGFPVTVEFSKPYASASTELPTSLSDLVLRLSNPGTATRVFLTPKGEATVRFKQPSGFGGVVEAHARRDAGTLLTNVAFQVAATAGADLPLGRGKTLGVSTIECVAATGKFLPRTAEGLRNGSANQTADAVQDLDGCLENVIDGELAQAVPKSSVAEKLGSAKKLLKAIALFDFEHQALDVLVNDSTPEADLVDVSFRWRGTGDRVPKAMVGDWSRHSTAYTIRADGTGEVAERTYTACGGVSLDCAFNASLQIKQGDDGRTTVTYRDVWYTDGGSTARLTLSAADHEKLDPYFPLKGDQMRAEVDQYGRLVLNPIGEAAGRISQRSDAGNTYCGKATQPGHTVECGA